jgi:GT2 family glycosyltransferase
MSAIEAQPAPVPRVFIQIAAWNSMKFLPELFRSLEAQTFRDFRVLVIDNASTDGLERFLAAYPSITVLRNFRNLGFARAQNQGIRWALKQAADAGQPTAESFVLLLNPDVVLTPICLERMVRCAESDPSLGSVGATLLRCVFTADGSVEFTDTIDSLGLDIRRSRQVVDRGAGTPLSAESVVSGEVFGISGALALYRLSALQDAAIALSDNTEYFDEDFFAYKEDVDLAWRLQLLGWRSAVAPEAVSYHHRGAPGGSAGLRGLLSAERRKGAAIAMHSVKNHPLLLIKNEHRANFIRHAPRIIAHEFAKCLLRLCIAPRALAGYAHALRLIPKMQAKRRIIQARAKRSAADMERWFV